MLKKSIIILTAILFISCNKSERKNTHLQSTSESSTPNISKEDFKEFFNKFSSDSSFRESRVSFPLNGFNSDEKEIDSKDTSFIWDKDDFLFYSEEDFKPQSATGLIKEFKSVSDSLIIYRQYKEDSGYDIRYRFENNSEKWYLTYYSYKNF